ncbi:MAG: DNA repair protein RecN [Acidobacteriota bacterium]|nr:DNA repair protein RecN [Acidobacteriota bacterium]
MLRFLAIEHLAVIDRLEVEFDAGLNVLTGETGAGKSILVEAVGLLLGGRATSELVRTGEEAASVQAVFERSNGTEVLVRREVTAQGRSRAFIDGTLATAAALRALAGELVELHGQHEHQTLLDAESHLAVLDGYARLEGAAGAVADAWTALAAAREALETTRREQADREARRDLLTFQLGEIDRVAPKAGEDEDLQATRHVLASADRLERLCNESYEALYDRDDSLLAQLGGVWRRVADLAAVDARFQPYLDARDGIKAQLEDLAGFLRDYAEGLEASPARLQAVEERLAALERLKRKYGPSLDEVIARGATTRRELDSLGSAAARIETLGRAVEAARDRYLAAARALSEARRTAAVRFARSLESELAELAMERTRFEVRFNPEPLPEARWGRSGIDEAEFYVSPNPGEDLRPLARIVSGGELSRVMLAIKTLASADAPGKTLIFDEVDAGIGGRVADVVGRKLQRLGRSFQVLCITHLPQMAAHAAVHFHIRKDVRDGRTVTRVERLAAAARVDELARMLGGAAVSERVRETAREMLEGRQGESEERPKGESEGRKLAKAKPGRRAQ